jgi:hypothetical protein
MVNRRVGEWHHSGELRTQDYSLLQDLLSRARLPQVYSSYFLKATANFCFNMQHKCLCDENSHTGTIFKCVKILMQCATSY